MASRVASEELMNKDQNPYPTSGSGHVSGVTIIGQTMRVQGAMTSREDVHLNGHWDGQMEMDGRLTIGAGGEANANIKARDVIVSGSVKGNVEVIGSLLLRADASLEGDVKTAGIVIEDGAYFKGGVDIVQRPSS